jgi:hypothetical protein
MDFSFYDTQLFRIVIDDGDDRTEGMTDADMIEAISAVYGTPVKRTMSAVRVATRVEIESGWPVARWGDASHSVVLYPYLVVSAGIPADRDRARSQRPGAQSRDKAARLDEQEAPSREVARQKKERDDGRAAAEKARVVNKRVFRP